MKKTALPELTRDRQRAEAAIAMYERGVAAGTAFTVRGALFSIAECVPGDYFYYEGMPHPFGVFCSAGMYPCAGRSIQAARAHAEKYLNSLDRKQFIRLYYMPAFSELVESV